MTDSPRAFFSLCDDLLDDVSTQTLSPLEFRRQFIAAARGEQNVFSPFVRRGPVRLAAHLWKALRDAIFKRDDYTCRYCGAQPPDVVLVCDHIEPVAAGGTTAIDNLLTSCEACNQGKAHFPLGERAVRPDADLMFLETQQEIVELRRFQKAQAEREAVIGEIVESLQERWQEISELDWCPKDRMLRSLLNKHSPDIVTAAVEDVAYKIGTGYVKSWGNKWIGYLYAVVRNLAADQEDDE